jgi:hypothetical protein
MPEALISTITSRAPGTGSEKFRELQFALAEERYAAHCLSHRRRRTGT